MDLSLNPCFLPQTGINNNPLQTLTKHYHVNHYDKEELAVLNDPGSNLIVEHTKHVVSTYQAAYKVLQEIDRLDLFKSLVYCLVPVFEDGEPGLADQKLGGVPDLREALSCVDTKRAKKKNGSSGKIVSQKFVTPKIWPRCGCCHENMKFVGQFNVYPWLLPIHVVTGEPTKYWGVSSSAASYHMVQHSSLWAEILLHTFVCPNASEHFRNPNYDAQILISYIGNDKYQKFAGDEYKDNTEAYLKSLPKVVKHENEFEISAQKIKSWRFLLGFDCQLAASYEESDKIEKILAGYPDVFACQHGRKKLFGSPVSQQEEARFWAQGNREGSPRRMTPFFSFDDEAADMTYQIYADIPYSDGYNIFGKVDASCT